MNPATDALITKLRQLTDLNFKMITSLLAGYLISVRLNIKEGIESGISNFLRE